MGLFASGKVFLVTALAFTFSTSTWFAWSRETSAPVAKLYKNGQFVADVLRYGKSLGAGGHGSVQSAIILDASGNESTIALRFYRFSQSNSEKAIGDPTINNLSLMAGWELVRPLGKSDPNRVLNIGITGMTLVPIGKTPAEGIPDVIMSRRATGSAEQIWKQLVLDPQSPDFEERLKMVAKYKRQILEAIEILGAHGLIHGDIKPANVLFFAKPDFDWRRPKADSIRFALTDFDAVKPFQKSVSIYSNLFAAPELVTKRNFLASPAMDIYSHAVSVYTLIFGVHPFKNFYEDVHREEDQTVKMDLKAERRQAYENSDTYEDYFQDVEQRFKDLMQRVRSPSARHELEELRKFVMSGLTYSPTRRLQAFPKIRDAMISYMKSGDACMRDAVSRIQALSAP
jgi:hypothetical protein